MRKVLPFEQRVMGSGSARRSDHEDAAVQEHRDQALRGARRAVPRRCAELDRRAFLKVSRGGRRGARGARASLHPHSFQPVDVAARRDRRGEALPLRLHLRLAPLRARR